MLAGCQRAKIDEILVFIAVLTHNGVKSSSFWRSTTDMRRRAQTGATTSAQSTGGRRLSVQTPCVVVGTDGCTPCDALGVLLEMKYSFVDRLRGHYDMIVFTTTQIQHFSKKMNLL